MSELKKPQETAGKKTNAEQVQPQEMYKQVESFFIQNKKIITGALIGIAVIIGGYFGYQRLYLQPKELDARNKISISQNFFAQDSFQLALNGDGINPGFLQLANEYGKTETGNIAKYYCGASYLKLKDLDNAIKYLEDYSATTDEMSGLKHLQLGHAFADKNDFVKSIENYKKAGELSKSEIYSPYYFKLAGDLMVMQNDFKGAKTVYEIIKRDYPLSEEGQAIDKDIAYTETKIGE